MAELPVPPREPKSMKEFDYFKEADFFDGANQSDVDDLSRVRLRRTLLIHGVMTLLVLVTVGTFAWEQRQLFAYHFNPPAMIDLGKAEEREGQPWPHGAFVQLQGITENKGAHATYVRGLTWNTEYWYVHLMGSPIFVEVPADMMRGKVEAFQQIRLQGRLIEVSSSREYQKILNFFGSKLFVKLPEKSYLLQAELKPDQAMRYAVAALLLLGLPLLNGWLWLRTFRRWRAI